MSLQIIVMVKQVPDTHNVSGDAMKPDGTVNRAVLPAIFNPEDLNALEEAIKIKETIGGKITAITMGPPNAVKILKECLYRGVDDVVLVSDRKFAGADTLATSYALKCAIEKVEKYDLVLCGRQAIDGDTAQVGPQIAEKLNINQLTCVSEIVEVNETDITIKRSIENGHEFLKSNMPVLLTVTNEANEPRTPSAKLAVAYKNISGKTSDESYDDEYLESGIDDPISYIKEWNVESINADPQLCGLSGSPTKVKKVQSVVLTASDVKQIQNTDEGIAELINELTEEHIIG
ncbi:MAG: electron transfer flavoprotein subunit beta/FixA family protein [Desulfobacterales bacterium]|jgi:electron transfer flavoprotein beta subunit|nr:electron transfer flavoprotein subunit beta/FixA family protein [Desulfobacteraceae bacterium]MBT4362978.1 electron transfer flavoprotein subunit beta/FixA family protein [Desulfobacteraceae bacterium]MBT7086171.1 electron transfer flavoprotein subunit beta/FixA family protein [Desulfobacterales bacterium]